MFDLILGGIVAAAHRALSRLRAPLSREALSPLRVGAHCNRSHPMTLNGWLQIALMLVLVVATARPLGVFMASVLEGKRTFLHPALRPVETRLLRARRRRSDARAELARLRAALLVFNAAGFVLLYAILRLQGVLPLNPQGFGGVCAHLAFNTAVRFVTNTNWQSYGGETTMSYFSQMVGLTVQNFVSAATGMAVAVAAGARLRAAPGDDRRQLLGRPDAHHALRAAAAVDRRRARAGRARRAADPRAPTSTRRRWKAPSRRSRWARSPARSPSSSSAPTAAASSTSTPRTRSRTRASGPTSSQVWAILVLSLGLAVTFGRMIGRRARGLGAARA